MSAPKATALPWLHSSVYRARKRNYLCYFGDTLTALPFQLRLDSELNSELDSLTCEQLAVIVSSLIREKSLSSTCLWSFPLFLALAEHRWELPALTAIVESTS